MQNSSQRGFSIIELLVASSLFIAVVAISAGSFLSVLDSSARARELQELSTNLDFALEDMSRNIRVGQNLSTSCGASCLTLDANEGGNSYQLGYELVDGVILKDQNGPGIDSDFFNTPLTTPDINVTHLTFNIDEAGNQQPRVIINMIAATEGEVTEQFVIQTSVTQRALDI